MLERIRVPSPAAMTTATRGWFGWVFTKRRYRPSLMEGVRASGGLNLGRTTQGCQTTDGASGGDGDRIPPLTGREQRLEARGLAIGYRRWAMTSISTRMSSGRRAAWMVVRAGYGSGR